MGQASGRILAGGWRPQQIPEPRAVSFLFPPADPQTEGRGGPDPGGCGGKRPGERGWHLDTHPEHLPQVGVPEPEGDVGDMEPLGLLLLCGVRGVELLAVRLCRLVCLLWGEDLAVRRPLSSHPKGRGWCKDQLLPQLPWTPCWGWGPGCAQTAQLLLGQALPELDPPSKAASARVSACHRGLASRPPCHGLSRHTRLPGRAWVRECWTLWLSRPDEKAETAEPKPGTQIQQGAAPWRALLPLSVSGGCEALRQWVAVFSPS